MSTYTDASLIVTPNAVKASKLYSLKGTDLDVVRNTTATYVGADGLIKTALANVPRLDYTNGSCPSILDEPQRTNLLLRSEEFGNSYWGKNLITVNSNDLNSPDGNLTADRITRSGSGNLSYIERNISSTNSTFSIFAKKGNSSIISIFLLGNAQSANFDLNSGTIISSTGLEVSPEIQDYGNGWFRCIMNNNSSISQVRIYINGTLGLLGDYIYIWGAQLEAGSNATSYIPTTTTAVTRNADVISKSGLTGITTITETFENGTTNVISGSPTSYTMSQGRIKNVIGL